MKEYTVRILDTVFADIDDIADYIVEVSTPACTSDSNPSKQTL